MKALVWLIILFFGVWDIVWLAAGVRPTLPWTLRKRLAQSPPPQLLDVRTPGEYALFHIPGAINRPNALVRAPATLGLDFSRPVVVVCMTGHRSPFVVRKLQAQGVSQVSNLTWGMVGWLLSGGRVAR